MKTEKINLGNVDFAGFSATQADLRDATVGHVNYALSQVDLAIGVDTQLSARGRVLFSPTDINISPTSYGPTALKVGQKYLIESYGEGDDFTNVGASENAAGVVFTATGEEANIWVESILIENAAQYINEVFDKVGEGEKYLKWVLIDGAEVSNKGFAVLGGPVNITETYTVFPYSVVDAEVVTENVEYFYGNLALIVIDVPVYDSTFPALKMQLEFVEKEPYLVISDATVDFNNYTVWSSPIIGVYRNLADAALRFPIKQTSRATAVSTGAYLEEFVGKDGKIYIPVFEPKLGLRFDFEIRLYDYVAPVPVIEVDVDALIQELKRLEDELKAETETNANDLKIAQLRSQIEAIQEVLKAEEQRKKLLEEEAAAALAKLQERA